MILTLSPVFSILLYKVNVESRVISYDNELGVPNLVKTQNFKLPFAMLLLRTIITYFAMGNKLIA